MQNHPEIAEFLWRIADLIKDDYEAKEYEDVILSFTLTLYTFLKTGQSLRSR